MTHFLDTLPLDFTDPRVARLRDLLIATFPTPAEIRMLLLYSGVPEAFVNFGQAAAYIWPEALDIARKQDKLRVLIAEVIRQPNSAAIRPELNSLLADTLRATPSAEAPAPADPIAWKVDANPAGLERQIETQPTLLDISFLQRGLELSRGVVKLITAFPTEDGTALDRFNGTAFRIGEDLLLTNHHVLFDGDRRPSAVEAWFGYERSFEGATREPIVIPCDPGSVDGDPVHDWAVVRVAHPMPDRVPIITLGDAAAPQVLDRVYIIQHPNGGVKKIGMTHNVVVQVTDDVVRYRTDTEAGSSGSPVFNEQWQVIGLHHRWETAKIDGQEQVFNQGRRMDVVAAALSNRGLI